MSVDGNGTPAYLLQESLGGSFSEGEQTQITGTTSFVAIVKSIETQEIDISEGAPVQKKSRKKKKAESDDEDDIEEEEIDDDEDLSEWTCAVRTYIYYFVSTKALQSSKIWS